ncbi:Ppx/GppA family phosphatase [Enterovirga aerilata]|uniref:Ppx/GppA family phosphatase n=1 Tax=Enterovirga aerilata TaxID=2730920 RepID=A0A849IHD4_9HYPH|nr:Ppx/GppA phosphatase family protein [Enterovirga sp. DB1703]NNM73333.1 Ppx/GppA family phosphatase [Enterovirga sp. DB1703]
MDRATPGRIAGREPIAIVDIGSNSVRLVIYEGPSRSPTPLYNEKLFCGLGRDIATTGRLSEEAVERALAALARFRVLCRTVRARQLRVLATAAARMAANGPAFLEAAEEACGAPVELLTGEREALLSAAGVISGLYEPDGVVGDLGGGSLEIVDVRGDQAGTGITLPLGGLVLRDMANDSPKNAVKIARAELAEAPQLRKLAGRTFYAVGGTWRALARMQMVERGYPLHVMHGYQFELMRGGFQRMVERTSPAALKAMASVSEARRPLLIYGAIVLDEIVRLGQPSGVTISALGVREGLLFEALSPEERKQDPLLTAAAELNELRARAPRHGEELRTWTDAFMESFGAKETPYERRLRHAACLLSDTGWRAHPDYRGAQSLAMIAHAALQGVDHPGRAFLALAVYFRHEGVTSDPTSTPLMALAGQRLAELAKLSAALFRIAYPITVAMAGILPRAPLTCRGGRIVLELPGELAPLASERLANRMRALGKLLDAETVIQAG